MTHSNNIKNRRRCLDLIMQENIASMKYSVANAESLSELRDNISCNINVMRDQVNVFCAKQKESYQRLHASVSELRRQLEESEMESFRLRYDLEVQKSRATTDSLTKLPNRYSYNERIVIEYGRWRRYRSPLSLVVADIDLFKSINDQFGHEAGDKVLQEVGRVLLVAVRDSDFVARIGGEEFVILLPATNVKDAEKAINKLRRDIKEIFVHSKNRVTKVTLSFGVSQFENSDTAQAVFARADKALYHAKIKGRDQVCCSQSSSTRPRKRRSG